MNSEAIQKIVFKLCETAESERGAYLKEQLTYTWFGSLSSIDEFVEKNEFENLSEEQIAQEYVDAA